MLLRDTLLRVAAAGCFQAHWSTRILEEMTRNLVSDYGMDPSRAEALRAVMEEAFPEASVEGWEEIEPEMRNDPKDRHVVAAAVAVEATIIVTSNICDFGNIPEGIIALTPDEFLSEIFARHPSAVLEALTMQAAAYRRPELTTSELIERLVLTSPCFAEQALKGLAGR
ncbi:MULTISPECIES: PIN domain-containing protein [unclassified Sinorhizobium]|uniref:PIN domain-containing protein n=1 Tax=unclassified Sinorhizobium TaxID=2613772 RepID=UPI0024C449B6|nr:MULTISPECIES: PIN domain-containing protein [unclassified Sinorhizobium]MDK1376432.1 PIN domain-containing protein [Sinorhizobium sp. 6-70]MDK1479981.1 PIN domain-containing protein [Sinorhizobium sp. 6-117]